MTNTDITFDPAPTCADKLRAKDLGLLEEDARRHGIPAIASAITARAAVVARPVVETTCLTDDDMYELERHCESLPGSGPAWIEPRPRAGAVVPALHWHRMAATTRRPFWLQICRTVTHCRPRARVLPLPRRGRRGAALARPHRARAAALGAGDSSRSS